MQQHQTHEQLPSPFSHDDLSRIEEAQRQIAIAMQAIARCERCKIPVQAAKQDAEDLNKFFEAILTEFRGPQGPTNPNPQGRHK